MTEKYVVDPVPSLLEGKDGKIRGYINPKDDDKFEMYRRKHQNDYHDTALRRQGAGRGRNRSALSFLLFLTLSFCFFFLLLLFFIHISFFSVSHTHSFPLCYIFVSFTSFRGPKHRWGKDSRRNQSLFERETETEWEEEALNNQHI